MGSNPPRREMAVGNTFGATALASYGGFWISTAIVLTPGGFEIVAQYGSAKEFAHAFGFFLLGWFIFTTMLLLCTLRSTVAFFLLFFFLDIAFLLLGVSYLYPNDEGVAKVSVNKAGGYFALFAAFMAWYNAFAGLADSRYVPKSLRKSVFPSGLNANQSLFHSNSFFVVPVLHFPWSEVARNVKTDGETV